MQAFKKALENAERDIYLTAYKYADYNQSETARLLGVSRTTLINRLKMWDSLYSKGVPLQLSLSQKD